MKKIILGIVVILIVVLIGGGIYYLNSPYKVAVDFTNALKEEDFDTAIEYIEPEKQKYIKAASIVGVKIWDLLSYINEDIPKDLADKISSLSWKVKGFGKDSSREAYITLKMIYGEDESITFDLMMVKEDGDWYIDTIKNVKKG